MEVQSKAVDWDKVDWNDSDRKIAQALQMSKGIVNHVRRALKISTVVEEDKKIRQKFTRFVQSEARKKRTSLGLKDDEPVVLGSVVRLVRKSKTGISVSSAQRVIYKMKVKVVRRNKSRYDAFWATINWELPDTDLAEIWNVDRANLLNRRRIMGAEKAKWTRGEDSKNYAYALYLERRAVGKFVGPKPSSSKTGGGDEE